MCDGNDVRTVTVENEPWFVAKDICDILEIKNVTRGLANLDDDEKGLHNVNTPGGIQNLSAISESGMYALVMRSRKPQAKQFRKWVTGEVLPTIRKTGGVDHDEKDCVILNDSIGMEEKCYLRRTELGFQVYPGELCVQKALWFIPCWKCTGDFSNFIESYSGVHTEKSSFLNWINSQTF